MSFEFYSTPSGTIGVASVGAYGSKDPTATVTVGSITSPPGVTPPVTTLFNDGGDERWIVYFDDLTDGTYVVQLAVSGGSLPPGPFSSTVGLSGSGVTIAHPANNATVRGKNVVTWGDSTHPITEATLTVNGVVYNGTVLRAPSLNRPYVIQFPKLTLVVAQPATLKIKNSNGDEITINVTVAP